MWQVKSARLICPICSFFVLLKTISQGVSPKTPPNSLIFTLYLAFAAPGPPPNANVWSHLWCHTTMKSWKKPNRTSETENRTELCILNRCSPNRWISLSTGVSGRGGVSTLPPYQLSLLPLYLTFLKPYLYMYWTISHVRSLIRDISSNDQGITISDHLSSFCMMLLFITACL